MKQTTLYAFILCLIGCQSSPPTEPTSLATAELSLVNSRESIPNSLVRHVSAVREFKCGDNMQGGKPLALITSDKNRSQGYERRTLLIPAGKPFHLLSVLSPPVNNKFRDACIVQNEFIPRADGRYEVTATLTDSRCNVAITQLDGMGGYLPVDLLSYKGCE